MNIELLKSIKTFCCKIAISFTVALNLLPQNGLCLTLNDVLVLPNSSILANQIGELNSSVRDSQCPFAEGKQFLKSFIGQINKQYGMNLTLIDACHLLRENIHHLDIPLEIQGPLLMVIELFEAENQTHFNLEPSHKSLDQHKWHYNIYWPWEWNYFGLNKKKHNSRENIQTQVFRSPELELPNHMAIGFALALAGALIFILPIPGAQ